MRRVLAATAHAGVWKLTASGAWHLQRRSVRRPQLQGGPERLHGTVHRPGASAFPAVHKYLLAHESGDRDLSKVSTHLRAAKPIREHI